MIFEHDFEMGIKDVGKDGLLENRAILEMLEDIGAYHSDLAGYGINDIPEKKIVWILLGWKLKVIKRPKYGQTIHIKTWGRDMLKAFTYRDFELYDSEKNLCAIATSKWTLINTDTNRVTRITDEIAGSYKVEDKKVFNDEPMGKIQVPTTFSNIVDYKVNRRDIDINGHMHNLYYLDLAIEALPEELYKNVFYNNVEIQYKKEIKMGEVVKCKYSLQDGKNIVVIYNQDETIIHAVVELF